MKQFREKFFELISSGTYQGMPEGKKLAIQVANCDAFLTMLTLFFYTVSYFITPVFPLNYCYPIALFLVTVGFFLIRYRYYDTGRILIHFNGLGIIFISADAFLPNSGYEFYYFVSITIPFITFSLEEKTKGLILSMIAILFLLFQHILGTGVFQKAVEFPPNERVTALIIILIYIVAIFAMARWQLATAQRELNRQQAELVRTSSMIALGEMSSGVAHEINNPLQALLLQAQVLKRNLANLSGVPQRVYDSIKEIDLLVFKMSDMIKGLRELSRDTSHEASSIFPVSRSLESALNVSRERMRYLGIDFRLEGDETLKIRAHQVQLAQVFINLLNNAIDANEGVSQKWIRINVEKLNGQVMIDIINAGEKISADVARRMMDPFFTTKEPSRASGLGLSISKNMVERDGGRLTYDPTSSHTRFVVVYPMAS